MSSISHGPARPLEEARSWPQQLVGREMWAGVAIVVAWLAVLFDAIFGPDILTTSAGSDRSSVPSAVAVSVFAFLSTWVIARYGFLHKQKE